MKGVQLVEKYIAQVVEFYISQTEAANHAVREAACACIAELGTKVSPGVLGPHIPDLVKVLLQCFRDDSWLVRDEPAACLAHVGTSCRRFPEECPTSLSQLLPLFFSSLEDSHASVRQGAASSLSTLVIRLWYKQLSEVEETVMSVLKREYLWLPPSLSLTPGTRFYILLLYHIHTHPGLDPRPAVFGVVQRLNDIPLDDPTHTDQQMYSCGSLAPKMRRGGCMDTHFQRPAEPWEKTEGCIHLLAELSQQKGMGDKVSSLLPALGEVARHHGYRQHLSLLETLLHRLPHLARGLGKRPFKRHLELFIDTIFYGAASDSALVKAAAADCLTLLSQYLGHVILRGRIEQHSPQ
ncbi:hypothetical protein GBAR_LOCUS21167 [Geodia barretti]|nr:hypothetical protein GBAR_LOCUS21167 [Geodia barretti]